MNVSIRRGVHQRRDYIVLHPRNLRVLAGVQHEPVEDFREAEGKAHVLQNDRCRELTLKPHRGLLGGVAII